MMRRNSLPQRFQKIWENHACVITGVRTQDPALSFACADHHDLARRAVMNALRLGYRRPALVLDADIEYLIDGRFSAGVYIAQRQLPAASRLQPFLYVKNSSQDPEALFRNWYGKERPDVILTLYHTVAAWVKNLGLRVPDDLGLIQLEWRQDHAHWAGMNQHNEQVGEAVVDMLVSMIHNGDRGIPPFPRATMIGSNWVDGMTVCQAGLRNQKIASAKNLHRPLRSCR
jgi:LacI family transcriptional regulator